MVAVSLQPFPTRPVPRNAAIDVMIFLVFRLADKPAKANLVALKPGKLFNFLNDIL